MLDSPSRLARNVILSLWAFTIVAWVLIYVFLLAPRETRPWYLHGVILLAGAAVSLVVVTSGSARCPPKNPQKI